VILSVTRDLREDRDLERDASVLINFNLYIKISTIATVNDLD